MCSDYHWIPAKPNICLCLYVFVVHTYIHTVYSYTPCIYYIFVVYIDTSCIDIYLLYIVIHHVYTYILTVQIHTPCIDVYIKYICIYFEYRYIHHVYIDTPCIDIYTMYIPYTVCIDRSFYAFVVYINNKNTIYGIIMVFKWYMVKIWNYYGILLMFHVKHWKTNTPYFSTHIKKVLTISTHIERVLTIFVQTSC